jgi:predicted metal-binding protein
MRFDLEYETAKSIHPIPFYVDVRRVTREDMLKYEVDRDTRNGWCTHVKPCSQYGMRPCCPPKLKMFSEFKPRTFVYLIAVVMKPAEYIEAYENIKNSKNAKYFGMSAAHLYTRNWARKILDQLQVKGDLAFKVGGCLGCKVKTGGACQGVRPALEAVGINVCELYKGVYGKEIEWYKNSQLMEEMVAVAGVYTDRAIPKYDIRQIIESIRR